MTLSTETVSGERLEPCPFCGGPAKEPIHYNGAMETGCGGPHECPGTDVLVPVAAWNRRALSPSHGEAVAINIDGMSPLRAAIRGYGEASKQVECPICGFVEGCDHAVLERLRFEIPPALSPDSLPLGGVKALEWRVPTDHPSDPDRDENVYCADGIGGKYAISKKQKFGPERLLWMADDPFVWVGYNSIPEAKSAAQADFNTRILSALKPIEPERISEEQIAAARNSIIGCPLNDDQISRLLTAALNGAVE